MLIKKFIIKLKALEKYSTINKMNLNQTSERSEIINFSDLIFDNHKLKAPQGNFLQNLI